MFYRQKQYFLSGPLPGLYNFFCSWKSGSLTGTRACLHVPVCTAPLGQRTTCAQVLAANMPERGVAQHRFSALPAQRSCKELSLHFKKERGRVCPPNYTSTGEGRWAGGRGWWWGQDSALPHVVSSCSTQPAEQSRDRDGGRALAQPSSVCPRLHAASGSMTVTPVPVPWHLWEHCPPLDWHCTASAGSADASSIQHRSDPREGPCVDGILQHGSSKCSWMYELQHTNGSVSLRCMKRQSALDLANAVLLRVCHFWQQRDVAIYHPGENGQVKNVSSVAWSTTTVHVVQLEWPQPRAAVTAAQRGAPSPALHAAAPTWTRQRSCAGHVLSPVGHSFPTAQVMVVMVWRSKLKRLPKHFRWFTDKPSSDSTQGDNCDLYYTCQETTWFKKFVSE